MSPRDTQNRKTALMHDCKNVGFLWSKPERPSKVLGGTEALQDRLVREVSGFLVKGFHICRDAAMNGLSGVGLPGKALRLRRQFGFKAAQAISEPQD